MFFVSFSLQEELFLGLVVAWYGSERLKVEVSNHGFGPGGVLCGMFRR